MSECSNSSPDTMYFSSSPPRSRQPGSPVRISSILLEAGQMPIVPVHCSLQKAGTAPAGL